MNNRILIIMAAVNFTLLMVCFAILIDNMQSLQNTNHSTELSLQRDMAINEVVHKRTQRSQWVYLQICQLKGNTPCLIVPSDWWADPKSYPLIADDPKNADLFPPTGAK